MKRKKENEKERNHESLHRKICQRVIFSLVTNCESVFVSLSFENFLYLLSLKCHFCFDCFKRSLDL